jgi:hypothetical protein
MKNQSANFPLELNFEVNESDESKDGDWLDIPRRSDSLQKRGRVNSVYGYCSFILFFVFFLSFLPLSFTVLVCLFHQYTSV